MSSSSPPSPSSSDDDADRSFDYVRVFENVGRKIYKYFTPQEIFSMQLTSRRIREHVGQHLIGVLKQNFHLPLTFDLGRLDSLPPALMDSLTGSFHTDRLRHWQRSGGRRKRASITSGCSPSFASRDGLVNHLVRTVLGGSGLRVTGTRSEEESLSRARAGLGAEETLTLEPHDRGLFEDPRFHYVRSGGPSLAGAGTGTGSIHCLYDDVHDRRKAEGVVERYFPEARCSSNNLLVKTWLRYILSQGDVSTRYWCYVLLHPSETDTVVAEGLVLTNTSIGDGFCVSFKSKM